MKKGTVIGGPALSWVEYKTVRQFHTLGEMLDEFRLYGYKGGIENAAQRDLGLETENGHCWLTEDRKL